MRRLLVMPALALLAVLAGLPTTPASVSATTAPPRSMAAIGDSMTQATNVCCWYGDHPSNSWSTGGAGWDGVLSHYERLRALDPDIAGNNHNNAVAGARMSSGPQQAQHAVDQRARYVTVLLGANDVCTSSPASMTSVDAFRSQFHETLRVLVEGLRRGARIFVASIPDVHRLWQLFGSDPVARLVWEVAGICQSLLDLSRTELDRQAVRDRTIAFNAVLAEECARYRQCRFDDNAVFEFAFTRSHVSRLDYFHPSLAGQAALADVTWARSWWS